jgi:CheY-like chemotaxis protein
LLLMCLKARRKLSRQPGRARSTKQKASFVSKIFTAMSRDALGPADVGRGAQLRLKPGSLGDMMKSGEVSILIVDDEEPIRRLLASYLSAHFTCVTAKSAEEAKKLLAAAPFNLVLTDVTMPGASGIELCEYINTAHPTTRVVIVSAKPGAQSSSGAKLCHAVDFIAKPFDLPQVLKTVKKALNYQAGHGDD